MMIAAGQNLKRLIKHNLEKPDNFLRIMVFPLLPKRPVTFSIAWIVMRRGPDLQRGYSNLAGWWISQRGGCLESMQEKRVGLALGGGIVRGLAHIGVLAVLEEAGIPIDFVAGTSVGAIIAAAYCAGWPVARIEAQARGFRWGHLIRPVWPKRGLVSFEPLANWLRREVGDLCFDDLALPCAVMLTDIEAGAPVLRRTGRIATVVQASCSVPGFSQPVELDGRLYGEGGVTDMLPASALLWYSPTRARCQMPWPGTLPITR